MAYGRIVGGIAALNYALRIPNSAFFNVAALQAATLKKPPRGLGLLVDDLDRLVVEFLGLLGRITDAGYAEFAILGDGADHVEDNSGEGGGVKLELRVGDNFQEIFG